MYRAAGIVPLNSGKVLLMLENRNGKDFYIDVGGKRESSDKDEWDTATREWQEETPLPKPNKIKEKLWFDSYNYICFVVEYDNIALPPGFIWVHLNNIDENLPLHPRIREILQHEYFHSPFKQR